MDFYGHEGILHANGKPFSIKGVNWFGSEAFNGPPGGLHHHTIGWYMDFLAKHEFNAVRVLFNHDHVLKNDIVDAPTEEPLLFQTRYIEMFEVIAREAAKRGILVMVACHRLTPTAWPGNGLWYDKSIGFDEQTVMKSWSKLAASLCGHWNVFAADVQNEPHASSWGKGNEEIEWNHGAERLGNHVLSVCARWLVMVEGVGYDPGAPGGDDPGAGFWWGENLVGVRTAPVVLSNQSKLVYSPHVYGPSVYMQHYFEGDWFPRNMPEVWQEHFAFAQELSGVPIVLGEIGGKYIDRDKVWQDWAWPYVNERGFGVFYFALNPDSKDTGGLVPADWSEPQPGSVEAAKLENLANLAVTSVFERCPSCAAGASGATARAAGAAGVFAFLALFFVGCLVSVAALVRQYKRGALGTGTLQASFTPVAAAVVTRSTKEGKATGGKKKKGMGDAGASAGSASKAAAAAAAAAVPKPKSASSGSDKGGKKSVGTAKGDRDVASPAPKGSAAPKPPSSAATSGGARSKPALGVATFGRGKATKAAEASSGESDGSSTGDEAAAPLGFGRRKPDAPKKETSKGAPATGRPETAAPIGFGRRTKPAREPAAKELKPAEDEGARPIGFGRRTKSAGKAGGSAKYASLPSYV